MKSKRHELILRLVSENTIGTQEELQQLLYENGCKYKYSVPALKKSHIEQKDGMIMRILSDAVISVDYAINTVVVKCHTGMAQAVCAKLDNTALDNVVGTIAGDDTIFILMRTEKDASRLVKELGIVTNK